MFLISSPEIELLYVYGSDLGYQSSEVEAWLEGKSSRVLVILEDDLGVLDALWKIPSKILHHPQIFLKFVPYPHLWEEVLEECARQFPYAHLQVVATHSYARKKSGWLKRIKLSIQRKTVVWNALLSEELLSPLFHRNILTNISRLPQTFYANTWEGAFTGVPAIICGAGPSLAQAQEVLKTWGEKALIFAGGSALSALGALNVQPHLAVAIDPNSQEYEHLKHLKSPETPLIFSSRLFPQVVELFSGPLGYLSSKTGGALEAFLEKRLDLDKQPIGPELGQEALSVTTLTAALAYAWGCNPIIFVGVDLAYTGMQMYAPGVVSTSSVTLETLSKEKRVSDQLIFRKNRHGKMVPTLVKWVMESDVLSQYAKEHSDRLFFDTSSEGLGFKHIPYEDLGKILDQHGTLRNLRQEIHEKIQETKQTLTIAEITTLFSEMTESLARCQVLVQEILKESLESGRKIVLEMDLEEEEAYNPFLAGTLFAFALARKQSFLIPQDKEDPVYQERASAFERAKWLHMKECIEKEMISLQSLRSLHAV
jgi:hypothetical protein